MIRFTFVLLLCGLSIGCNQATSSSPAPDKAADVKLKILDYEGIQKLVASHQGKVVVMDAWSTACPPCMEEFPHLVELHKKYGPDRVACISLSFDYEGLGKVDEVVEPVLEFLRAKGATFDNVVSTVESDVLYRKFDLASVPAVFVYDRQGTLSKRFDNQKAKRKEDAFTYAQVGQLVAELLEK